MNKSPYLYPVTNLVKEEIQNEPPIDWELILSQLNKNKLPNINTSVSIANSINRITRKMYSREI